MRKILSIIIPTKNRLHYLKDALLSINLIESDDYEVIIQDNSDNHLEVESFVKELNNKNFIYFFCGDKLSQTENSDLALSHASGEYVTFIGDDDSVCELMIKLAYNMKKYNIESSTYSIPKYYWPDLIEKVPGLCTLEYCETKGKIKKYSGKAILIKSLKEGMYDISNMPRVYHGIVSMNLLKQIKNSTGSFFPGPSPDMANATVVSLYTKKHIHIDIPMIVSGYGKNSAGGMGRRNLHKGSLKGNFQLRDDVEKDWNPKIPKLWTSSTIYPQSATTALNACGEIKLLDKMNYGAIYFETIWHDSETKLEINKIQKTLIDKIGYYQHFVRRIFKKFFVRRKKNITKYDSLSLVEATNEINRLNEVYNLDEIFVKFMN